MSELLRKRGSEGYGACGDAAAMIEKRTAVFTNN